MGTFYCQSCDTYADSKNGTACSGLDNNFYCSDECREKSESKPDLRVGLAEIENAHHAKIEKADVECGFSGINTYERDGTDFPRDGTDYYEVPAYPYWASSSPEEIEAMRCLANLDEVGLQKACEAHFRKYGRAPHFNIKSGE